MIDFYNAFISYRHAELDSKVAEHVQRSLEHFHIPHAIRKKTGKKKIERIFRDKDELPITSDLTDTISNALEKADYLIVICSHNTCESIWVEREINFFLKNHSKNKILTVLADGEPTEVIPKILQQDERVVKDEDGTERTIKVNIEPLSCDYRMPLNKAKKLELPRLAAALIGCSYDELVRRQRAYKTRRLMIVSAVIAAAAIVFGGYMYRSKLKVDQALRQSLIDQNRYLAIQSDMLLEDDHRLDAIHLALAALPEDLNDEGAVTGEAMAALATATNAYVTQHGSNVG
ncbi:MAG: toll/interleukin-1 receptor domain-containing protein, partial [Clostridiales bacterium]|nr:toll/interleukin-1 receptor domain-containing protein [Clostridiales bacterium]